MKFAHKIFICAYLTTLFAIISVALSLTYFFEQAQHKAFVERYTSLTDALGYTLVQVEKNTDLLMKNAAMLVRERLSKNKNLTVSELKTLAREIGVTHIFLIDKNGRFYRSTNEDPSLIPNLFTFSPKYKELITGASDLEKTPIIPPKPEPQPFKFLLVPSADRQSIIEVGVRADFIAETLQKALKGDPKVRMLTLYDANGMALGTVGAGLVSDFNPRVALKSVSRKGDTGPLESENEMVTGTQVTVDANSNVQNPSADGDYHYTLVASISKEDLVRDKSENQDLLLFVLCLSLILSLFLSLSLSRRLVSNIDAMTEKLNHIFSTDELTFDLPSAKDELARLSEAFDAMAARLRADQKKLLNAQRSEAIARMTEMFAHDVRKPFSIFRIALRALGDDSQTKKGLLDKVVSEVERAAGRVDGLITDVMEIGSTSKNLVLEPVCIQTLIQTALIEAFHIYPQSDIELSYNYKHTHLISVHVQKILRVFSNIITNAVQAMSYKGEMWFKTQEYGSLVEICIGNSGSFIENKYLTELFQVFYTRGKKNGTGLGLAIAEKIVIAHGGTIWCRSSKTVEFPEGSVEFFFTLPIDSKMEKEKNIPLETHSSRFNLDLVAKTHETAVGELSQEAVTTDIRTTGALQPVPPGVTKVSKPKIVILDDSPLVLYCWKEVLSNEANVITFGRFEEFEIFLSKSPKFLSDLFLVITDLVFEKSTFNGVDVAKNIKNLREDIPVFLSTDGLLQSNELAVAIDTVIAKAPQSLSQLVTILNQLDTSKPAPAQVF
ncbi:MAG: ATP-binding protein [Oligoflexales bacterium]